MSERMTYNPVTGRYTYRIDPIVDVTGIPAVETELSLRKNSTAYSFGARVLYPGIGKAGYVLVYSSALPMRYTASSLPEFPGSVTSGATTLQDGQVTWTIYDLTAPEISMVNGLNTALGNKADKDLSNLTAHTAIDSNCPVDYVIYRGTGTNTWYRIWKSGWVEQGGSLTGGSTASGAALNFPVKFAGTDYTLAYSVHGAVVSTAVLAAKTLATSISASSVTVLTTVAAGGNNSYNAMTFEWYACGQGDSTDIAALLE